MAIFKYKAFNASGTQVEDYIEAVNVQMAQRKLRQQSYYITDIKEDIAKRDRQLFPFLAKFLYRISHKEMGLFAKQLGTLLGAGISLNQALTDVWEQMGNPNLKKIVGQMKEDVVAGKSLSQAIEEHSDVFPPVYANMIRVGEATGSYEKTLNRLADLEEKNEELKSKAITALIYPIIIMVISIGVVLFLLTSVVPQIETMFAQFEGSELPLPTKIVLGISSVFRDFWYLLILLLVGGFAGIQLWRQSPEGKLKWDRFRFKIPLLGKIQNKIIVSRFARNLGTLIDSNVSLLTALDIISDMSGSEIFKQELKRSIQEVREGSSLKKSLHKSEILPQITKGMISAGESTDRMAEILLKVADIMETEVDAAVRGLTSALEPIMIVFMGVVVGGIMVSVMLPLYKMTELIK